MIVFVALGVALPAWAVDMEYGGYWNTRAYTMDGFTGDGDDESMDFSKIDAEGHLWTRHFINDTTSWKNQVEFYVTWGDDLEGGGIGTAGSDYFCLLHSYVDVDTFIVDKDVHFRIGLQSFEVGRSLLFDDEFAGMIVSHETESAKYSLIGMKAFEGSTLAGEYEEDLEDLDVNFIGVTSEVTMMDEMLTVKPFVFYLFSEDARSWEATSGNKDLDVYYLGAELNYEFDAGKVWAVGIYEAGTAEAVDSNVEFDVNAYAVAFGGEYSMDDFGFHGQIIYASGDDDLLDDDVEAYTVPQGQDYIWSEIMGMGVFDDYGSNGSCGNAVSNLVAYNLGLSYDFSETFQLTGDLWYAEHAEANDELLNEDKLGTEVDLRGDWQINEDLSMILVGAYLFADDATTMDAMDDTDVYEIGMQLEFRFNSAN